MGAMVTTWLCSVGVQWEVRRDLLIVLFGCYLIMFPEKEGEELYIKAWADGVGGC